MSDCVYPAEHIGTQHSRDNEIDALEQKLARADARIAELERECSQWRDELRIYRETENKRIAELEAKLSAACDIICDLGGEFREPDMIDAQIRAKDAKRYRWLRDQGGREVDTPWVVFRGGTWFLRSELDAAIDAARAGNGGEG